MASATITLSLPRGAWIGRLSRDHDTATFRVVSVVSRTDSGGVGLLEVTTEHPTTIVEAARAHDEIATLEVLEVTDDHVLFQFETGTPRLLDIAKRAGIPIVTPFTIQDGKATWELTAPHENLANLARELTETGISYTVDEVRSDTDASSLLSDRQAQLITEAIDRGYYETPRTCTLTELAETADIAKSTCSETLHRAESAIIKEFADTHLADATGVLSLDAPSAE